jgi:hypothetical protein
MVLVEDHARLLGFFRAFRGVLNFCSHWRSPTFVVRLSGSSIGPLSKKRLNGFGFELRKADRAKVRELLICAAARFFPASEITPMRGWGYWGSYAQPVVRQRPSDGRVAGRLRTGVTKRARLRDRWCHKNLSEPRKTGQVKSIA